MYRGISFFVASLILLQGLMAQGMTLCIKYQQESKLEFECGEECNKAIVAKKTHENGSIQEHLNETSPCVDIHLELGNCLPKKIRKELKLFMGPVMVKPHFCVQPILGEHLLKEFSFSNVNENPLCLKIHHSIASTVLLI